MLPTDLGGVMSQPDSEIPEPRRSPHELVCVANNELFTVRVAMRELNRIVDRLQAGDLDHAVLMKGGQMVAEIRRLR